MIKTLLIASLLTSLLIPTATTGETTDYDEHLKILQLMQIERDVINSIKPSMAGIFYPGRTMLIGAKPDRFDWESVLQQPPERRWGNVWLCQPPLDDDQFYWFDATVPMCSMGACDSHEECETEMEDACVDAGHGGVDKDTVLLIPHLDGSSTCSGDCNENGAIAFITCNAGTN